MSRSINTALAVAALAALAALPVATHDAFAAKGGGGGKGKPKSVTILFGDAAGDGVQSDGLGSYAATLSAQDGSLDLSTGAREFFFDFSTVVTPDSFDPFGASASSGSFSDVELTVIGLDGPVGNSAVGQITFEFSAPAPDGSGQTDWRVYFGGVTVDRSDTDGDGAADTFALSFGSSNLVQARLGWLGDVERRTPGQGAGGGPPQDDGWRLAGTFEMPWTAEVAPQ